MNVRTKLLIDETATLRSRFFELNELLLYPEIQADKNYYLKLLEERNELLPKATLADELCKLNSEIDGYKSALLSADNDEKALYNEEIKVLTKKSDELTEKLNALFVPSKTERNGVIVELRAKNDVARQFIAIFCDLIIAYGKQNGWQITITKNVKPPKSDFPRLLCMELNGNDAYSLLQNISGVYKLSYYSSATEKTLYDTATAVVYETQSANVIIDDNDLKIDVFHSGGAGGQNINKVETAIRITHIPSGITVTCQDERSQLRNKERAKETLTEKLRDLKLEEIQKSVDTARKKQTDAHTKTNTAITVDMTKGILTDKRLPIGGNTLPFPPKAEIFGDYLQNLMINGNK